MAPEDPSAIASTNGDAPLSDTSRWLGALSYLSFIAVFVLYEIRQRPRPEFVRFHARQGFTLLFLELVLFVLSIILDNSIGEIPVLGAIVMIVFRLAGGLFALVFSVWGFVEALGGEKWPMPFFGEYAKRVPIGD